MSRLDLILANIIWLKLIMLRIESIISKLLPMVTLSHENRVYHVPRSMIITNSAAENQEHQSK